MLVKAENVVVPDVVREPTFETLPTVPPSEIVKIGLLPLLILKSPLAPWLIVKPAETVTPELE